MLKPNQAMSDEQEHKAGRTDKTVRLLCHPLQGSETPSAGARSSRPHRTSTAHPFTSANERPYLYLAHPPGQLST